MMKPSGPIATPALPAGLTGSRRLVLDALDAQQGQLTVEDLAGALDLHANSIRGALIWLVDHHFVERESAAPVGRGRPGHLYAMTVAGRAMLAVARAGGGSEYRGLAEAFARRLASRPDAPDEARTVGELWGREMVGAPPKRPLSARAAHKRVLTLLTDLGFGPEQAAATPVGTDGRTVAPRRVAPGSEPTSVVLRTCPLLESALQVPDVICAVHAGMIAGALTALGGSDDRLDLEPFSDPHGCRLTVG